MKNLMSKWLWLAVLVILFIGLYPVSFLAFSAGVDVIAFPMVLGGAAVIGAITYEYFIEYWI